MSTSIRQYDLILLGATGYTGKLTAEHINEFLPVDLKWAVAGRSAAKLESLIEKLKSLNPKRLPPCKCHPGARTSVQLSWLLVPFIAIEVCTATAEDLDALAKKTKVIITLLGPYAKYGTPVVEACVKNGTHYLDT
jgi:short subunit dehydrogenase-like uncharacterized protein